MKKTIYNTNSILFYKSIITVCITLFSIVVSDFFFSIKKLLWFPTSIVLAYNLIMLFLLKSTYPYSKNLMFIGFVLMIIYFSFLANYFFLDLSFVAVYCLLFIHIIIFFNTNRKIILISIVIIFITFLLFLFREQNYIYRCSGENILYIDYLRATSAISIVILFYFLIDFWVKRNKSKDNIRMQQLENHSALELSELFECIKRRDNSFMPLFLTTNTVFINKIKELCPKINENELEVCALIKLGLNTKEIATATNSTYKAIESAKYRIRKKMHIDSSTNMMLFFNEI